MNNKMGVQKQKQLNFCLCFAKNPIPKFDICNFLCYTPARCANNKRQEFII